MTLIATYYAVPQKRKRVIIICTRNDLSILPSDLFPEPITVTEEEQVTARETIFDLENVECSEKFGIYSFYNIHKFFKKLIPKVIIWPKTSHRKSLTRRSSADNKVGNAVPTLLAYQIARKIKKKTGCCKAIDLFCGAGGMTVGFKEAYICAISWSIKIGCNRITRFIIIYSSI